MKGSRFLTLWACVAAIPFLVVFFLFLPFLGLQHMIQHWRGQKSWMDEWGEEDLDGYDYV